MNPIAQFIHINTVAPPFVPPFAPIDPDVLRTPSASIPIPPRAPSISLKDIPPRLSTSELEFNPYARLGLGDIKNPNYYQIFGLEPTASSGEIKKAYFKLSLIHHPDKGGDERTQKLLVEAKDILSDETKRKQYDNLISQGKDGKEIYNPQVNNIVPNKYGMTAAYAGGNIIGNILVDSVTGKINGEKIARDVGYAAVNVVTDTLVLDPLCAYIGEIAGPYGVLLRTSCMFAGRVGVRSGLNAATASLNQPANNQKQLEINNNPNLRPDEINEIMLGRLSNIIRDIIIPKFGKPTFSHNKIKGLLYINIVVDSEAIAQITYKEDSFLVVIMDYKNKSGTLKILIDGNNISILDLFNRNKGINIEDIDPFIKSIIEYFK
jgi:hypothetical protein